MYMFFLIVKNVLKDLKCVFYYSYFLGFLEIIITAITNNIIIIVTTVQKLSHKNLSILSEKMVISNKNLLIILV
jgi:hypothetical protein